MWRSRPFAFAKGRPRQTTNLLGGQYAGSKRVWGHAPRPLLPPAGKLMLKHHKMHPLTSVHDRIILLELKFEIEPESIFNGNCVPELSISVPKSVPVTTQVDESSLLNRPMHFIVCSYRCRQIWKNSITEPTICFQ